MKNNKLIFLLLLLASIMSCSKDNIEETIRPEDTPKLIFKFKFNPDQERLGNFGEPEEVPVGHAAQTPTFNMMGAHYIELSEQFDIPAYNGTEIIVSPVTNEGGSEAIDFDQAMYGGDGDIFYSKDLSIIEPGIYEHVRISLSYQNYTIDFRAFNQDFQGTIASFVGANTYINSYTIKDESVKVDGNKLQGYWAFEADIPDGTVTEGQAPEGATTVPNPLFDSSPIPAGSCLVTGTFASALTITGNETEDITIICSVSINNSFEWIDNDGNETYDPLDGDQVVDMGVRGLIPFIEQ